jgi:hypothetical protein
MSVVELETPWFPGGQDTEASFILLNPHGVCHLAFDELRGQWQRLRQHHEPEQISAAEAMLLRPSDIDQVIKVSNMWALEHPGDPHARALVDQISMTAKELVMHYAALAGAV